MTAKDKTSLENNLDVKIWKPTMMLRNVRRVISSSNYHCETGLFLQQMWTSNLGDIEWRDVKNEIELL